MGGYSNMTKPVPGMAQRTQQMQAGGGDQYQFQPNPTGGAPLPQPGPETYIPAGPRMEQPPQQQNMFQPNPGMPQSQWGPQGRASWPGFGMGGLPYGYGGMAGYQPFGQYGARFGGFSGGPMFYGPGSYMSPGSMQFGGGSGMFGGGGYGSRLGGGYGPYNAMSWNMAGVPTGGKGNTYQPYQPVDPPDPMAAYRGRGPSGIPERYTDELGRSRRFFGDDIGW